MFMNEAVISNLQLSHIAYYPAHHCYNEALRAGVGRC